MVRVYCVLLGYVFGMIQTSYFLGKAKGIDIRTKGSGNAGTTNTLRVLGPKAGLFVLACDILKTMIACFITKQVFVPQYPGMSYLLVMYTAAGAILGHNFPFYLKFKGGKGIAATAGLILSLPLSFIIVGNIAFFGTWLTTKFVSLGSLLVYVCFFVQLVIEGQLGMIQYKGVAMPTNYLYEMYVVCFCLAALAFFMHRKNIVRLLKGEERKTYLLHKNQQ